MIGIKREGERFPYRFGVFGLKLVGDDSVSGLYVRLPCLMIRYRWRRPGNLPQVITFDHEPLMKGEG